MIAAAIPLKRLSEAKSRLGGRLSPHERRDLVLWMLRRTVDAVMRSGSVQRLAIVTPESDLADLKGLEVLPDREGLNASLAGAVEWATILHARSLLILPGDLPLIEPGDVREVIQSVTPEARGVAIVRMEDGGTGALYLQPPDLIPLAFGPDSFERHLALARQKHLDPVVLSTRGLAHDVDTPDDLDALLSGNLDCRVLTER
jgi:2-phospho-L-lactate guanylyltransferase